MPTTLNTKKILHRPQLELVNPIPSPSAAGSFVNSLRIPALNINHHYFMVSLALTYAWDPVSDTELTLPASGLAGTFGAGACGEVLPMGPSGTATAGGASSVTTNLTLLADLRGYRIRITAGPAAGDTRIIASNTIGANSVITVSSPFSQTITTSSLYQLMTPRLWAVIPSTGLGFYDFALGAWTTGKSVVGLTLAGTDGVMRSTHSVLGNILDAADIGVWPNSAVGAIGTATAVFASCASALLTLTSGRNWTINQWAGAVISVIAGTGAGQTRTVVSNTALSVTASSNWTTPMDATSVWEITRAFASSGSLSTFGSTTTTILTVTGSNWAVNQWANFQIRAISGTGAGQIRTISANTALTLTVSAAWTTNFDATTVWVIEGNDDNIYVAGNNLVGMFKYSISGNAWTTAAATAARAGAPGAGLSLEWPTAVNDASWTSENAIKNGRYLYSFRGAGGAILDQYDLAATTWASGLTYANSGETFAAGCCFEYDGVNFIFIAQAATGRFFLFDLLLNTLKPCGEYNFTQGAAVAGDKLFILNYVDGGTKIPFLYHWTNSLVSLVRIMVWYLY